MFGADTTNQTQTDNTLGDASAALPTSNPQPATTTAPTLTPAPADSSDSTELVIEGSDQVNGSQNDIPEFTPPDDNGKIISNSQSSSALGSENLMNIKKEALEKLGPLVDKLEQSPEEKFKTLMMMIQASDDQSLVSKAYDAASNIAEENSKAQALLDIINEINYFTNQSVAEK
jgi:hypothetical protein